MLSSVPFAVQVFYMLVYTITVEYVWAALGRNIKKHWRWYYVYTSVVFFTYSVYITLRLLNVLDNTDYAKATIWFGPLLASCLVFPGLLIHWEKTFYIKAMRKRMPLP